ncbi:unnamed protein product [Bursaphelenchus xylophilus]|uniref:(pine wood nematode) hypothetical protein n=1 Tax=Bursaphelenchus xylophilus TaxID=6326 RepID=A0A1I7SUS1_BURXY|nr:unnamed protein product [Bursaphelenchus xylophilus]CAG9125911.1 unnamed protein product [Bursaphelenchus xylophilus]
MQSGKATLSINHLGMKLDTEETGRLISNMIDAVAKIECLIMSGNTLGVDASKVIADSLSRQPTLREAIFADMFTGRLKSEIPLVLKNLSDAMIKADVHLDELDLSDNAIGPMAIPGIQEFLSSSPCFSLRKLYFNNCGLGAAGITIADRLEQCKANAARAGKKFELKVFIAGRNRQENNGAIALGRAFNILGTLERIELPQNGIKKEGIVALAKGIQGCPNLRYLNLNDNTCDKEGARALAEAIPFLPNLEHVDIGDCLCRRGAVDVVAALVENCLGLKYLDLSGNEITPSIAEEIIELILGAEDLVNLRHVKMGLNCYGSEFDRLVEYAEESGIFDFGEEDEDDGSLAESDEEEED